MSLTKYAEVSGAERTVEVLDSFVVPENVGHRRLSRLRRRAHRHHFDYTPRPGYIYVRSRAISSRCNDNYDEFPAAEIKKAYATFKGKPCFVNHHNADHRRARGVIIDAALHEDINPDGSEDTWAEVLMEIDAVSFPVLAREVRKGNIARTSMGTDVEYSVCTACGNKAATPADYCQHIPKMKGMKIVRRSAATGLPEEVLIAERCYGLGFFENSLLVEDPADPTAFAWMDSDGDEAPGISAAAAKAVIEEAEQIVRAASAPAPSMERTASRTAGVKTKRDFMGDFPGIKDVSQFDRHPQAESMESYGFRMGNDVVESGDYKSEDFDSFHTETINVPLSEIRYKRGQSHVIHPYVEYLSTIPQSQFDQSDLPFAQRMPDGSVLLMEGHHRSAAASLRGDRALKMTVYGKWGKTASQRVAATEGYLTSVKGLVVGTPLWYGRGLGHSVDVTVSAVTDTSITIKGDARTGFTKTIDDDDLRSFSVTLAPREEDMQMAASRSAVAALSVEAIQHTQYCDLLPSALENLRERGESNLDSQDPAVQIEIEGYNEMGLSCACGTPDSWHSASRLVHAYGETKAPAKVDTLRAESCPVCGDDEAYNGDKCTVCGYTQPPDQFKDPDLTKAREMDLRQEQIEDGVDPLDPQAVDAPVDGAETLKCDQCGEVFGGDAEGQPEAGAEAEDPAAGAPPFEDPEVEDGTAAEPADLDDETYLSDDEIFADDEDPEDPTDPAAKVKVEDPETDTTVDIEVDKSGDEAGDETGLDSEKSQVKPGVEVDIEKDKNPDEEVEIEDPAVGEARITAEPEESTDTTLDTGSDKPGGLDAPVEANQTCPICGVGVLIPEATILTKEGDEPKIKEVGNDPTKAKENRVAMNQPNPAQKQRSKIIAAVQEQQGVIETIGGTVAGLERENRALKDVVAHIAAAAGLGSHPKFAGLIRSAGLTVRADNETNEGDSIGGTPATTTEEAKKPDAVDNVETVGTAPAPANVGVTPAGVTDVNTTDVTANPPVLDNLQSVTAPVSGTDAVDPKASDQGANRVEVGTPSNETFDKPGDSGWKSSAAVRGSEQERFIASTRLARLQIEAGLATGEDLALAQQISASQQTLGEINVQVSTMAALKQASLASAPTDEQTRRLVPRAANRQGITPVRQQPSLTATAGAAPVAAGAGDDEWGIGGVGNLDLDA